MQSICAGNTTNAASQVADRLPQSLSPSAKSLFSVLVQLAFDVIEDKAYRAVPTHVTYHSSLTLVAAVAGMNRITCWRSLARLKALGCVDWKSHKVMFRGRASNSGTVFQVRLNAIEGTRAKLSYHDLKHQWKDLERAARCKRLAGTMLKPIQALESKSLQYECLKQWTLKPYTLETRSLSYRLQPSLEAILGVSSAQGKDVAKQVDLAAVALSQALQDKKSTDFYRKLLYALKRRYSANEGDEFHTVYLQANRIVKGDLLEWKGLQRPGALLIHRLKGYRWFEDVLRV